MSFPCFKGGLWTSVELSLASSGYNWHDKTHFVSLGKGLDAPQSSESLEPMDSPLFMDCIIYVLSYNKHYVTQSKAWALCSCDFICNLPGLGTLELRKDGNRGVQSRRRARQVCRVTQHNSFLTQVFSMDRSPRLAVSVTYVPDFTCPFAGWRAGDLGE